jgi:hypothetical protein
MWELADLFRQEEMKMTCCLGWLWKPQVYYPGKKTLSRTEKVVTRALKGILKTSGNYCGCTLSEFKRKPKMQQLAVRQEPTQTQTTEIKIKNLPMGSGRPHISHR